MDFGWIRTRRFFQSLRLLGALIILAVLIGPSHEEAGSFFAEMPKNAPRMGRRSEFVPEKKASRMKYFYAEIPKSMPRIGRRSDKSFEEPIISPTLDDHAIRLSSLVSSLRQSDSLDRSGEKCLTLRDLLQIQAFGRILSSKLAADTRFDFKEDTVWPEDEIERISSYTPRHLFLPSTDYYTRNED